MRAMSKPWGQRVEQVRQAAQSQGVLLFKTASRVANLHQPHDLIRRIIEKVSHRTTAGAANALVAEERVLSGLFLDFPGQIRFNF